MRSFEVALHQFHMKNKKKETYFKIHETITEAAKQAKFKIELDDAYRDFECAFKQALTQFL